MKEKHNIGNENDDLIITSGAQQIMDLATKSLCNEGDVIICEAPSFIGSLNSFRSYNAKLVGVPVESDGMNIEILEEKLKTEKNVKLIYVIPNFQNPSGVTTSLEKRKAIYELAKKYGVLIIEDNPYGDLRYSGEYVPSIKSLDTDGIVIYAGSFSKVISPGMRVGWCVAPAPVIQKMVVCKQGQDVHTNIWSQMVAYEFVTKYDFDAHLEMLRKLYSKKAQLMMDLLDEHLAPYVTYDKIDGGLFIMCKLPEHIDMLKFCKEAVLRKVCVVPGNAFLADESEVSHSFRVNFSTPTDEQLVKGVKILGELVKELCE
jgi:2-aminoadipate transaminase